MLRSDFSLVADCIRRPRSPQLCIEFDREPMIPAATLVPHPSEPMLSPSDHAQLLEVSVTPFGPGATIDEVAKPLEPLQSDGYGFPLSDDDLDPHEGASCTADADRIP